MKINLTKALAFFKGWGIENSYVLGLLFADGNVCHQPGKHYVSLELKDIDYVYEIAKIIDPEIQVSRLQRTDGRTSAKFYLSRLAVVEDCIAKGLIPAKTHKLQWPKDIPYQFVAHFVRGYFDGNGGLSFSFTKNGHGYISKSRTLSFSCGSNDFTYALQDEINKHTGIKLKINDHQQGALTLFTRRKSEINSLCYWMYSDSNGLYLPRKFKKWHEVME